MVVQTPRTVAIKGKLARERTDATVGKLRAVGLACKGVAE